MKRRLSAGLLCLLMICSLCTDILPGIAAATTTDTRNTATNAQQINPNADGGTAKSDNITISKTIAPTDKENYFDITLTITDEETFADNSTDVVLVMDISNTMNSNGRLGNAKSAAVSFLNQFAAATNKSDDCRVGLVTFNTNATIGFALTDAYTSPRNIKTINDLVAPADAAIKYTNIEGGLLMAQKMLSTSQAKHKFIILITDGFPTTYTRTQGNTQMTGWDVYYKPGPAITAQICPPPLPKCWT